MFANRLSFPSQPLSLSTALSLPQTIEQSRTNKDHIGFVVYGRDGIGNRVPIGIVGTDVNKKALCDRTHISARLYELLIQIEDKRYYRHFGLDIKAFIRAAISNFKKMRITQGGSTITQQLARCILNDYRKSLWRKWREAILAIKIERSMTKHEILELYANNICFGGNIYGVRTASLCYFAKEPANLSLSEQVCLVTLLRKPNGYLKNRVQFENRHNLICQNLVKSNIVRKQSKISLPSIGKSNQKHLYTFGGICAREIATSTKQKTFTLTSGIIRELQDHLCRFIYKRKYAMSIICIGPGGEIIASGSSYGSNYPFQYKANVGSTLKPFIYCFLRKCGISTSDKFASTHCHADWQIREYSKPIKEELTLGEALSISNNNAFVNAANFIGIERVLNYLACVLGVPQNELVPASILGATTKGLSLCQLTQAYYEYFKCDKLDDVKIECIAIMQKVAASKLMTLPDLYLKTGTTNNFNDRYAIIGYAKALFGFLRHDKSIINDTSKEGDLLPSVFSFFDEIKEKIKAWL